MQSVYSMAHPTGLKNMETPASLSNYLIVWIAKFGCYPYLQFIFGVAQSFVGLSLNCAPHILIKGIVIWGVRLWDVMSDGVTEIFWQPTLCISACVAFVRVILSDVGSSSSHPLDSERHYLLSTLDLGLCVESEAMWEDEWRHDIIITSGNPKHYDVDWVFGFHHYKYILLPTLVLWVHPLILTEIFLIWEKLKRIQLKMMFKFAMLFFPLVPRDLW